MKKLIALITSMIEKSKKDNVSAFAAESSLFILMGFFPVVLLFLLLIQYTPVTEEILLKFITDISPGVFRDTLTAIIGQLFEHSGTSLLFFTIISLLWAAGKGFLSIIDGLNSVFDIEEHRNWIVLRLYSIFYTVILLVIILIGLYLVIPAGSIMSLIEKYVPIIATLINTILNLKLLLAAVLLTFFFTALYVVIPNRHTRMKYQLPGALFSSVGWIGFSFFFSLYISHSRNFSTIYGSLTTIVCAMLWLYICMYIFLLGAELNILVEQYNIKRHLNKALDITHSGSKQ